MIVYRRTIVCGLYQTFDETGTLLSQFLQQGQDQFLTIDTETEDENEIDSAEVPLKLELDPELAESGIGEKDKLKTYTISFSIVVQQLFDANGKPLGQIFKRHIDDEAFGEPFGSVANRKGRKMKSTHIKLDEDLPFPYIPLPFPYVLRVEFVQPKRLSEEEKRLVEEFL